MQPEEVKLKLEDLGGSYEFRHLTKARFGSATLRRALIEQLKQEEIMEEHAVIAFVCTKKDEDRAAIDGFRRTADSIIDELRKICTLK